MVLQRIFLAALPKIHGTLEQGDDDGMHFGTGSGHSLLDDVYILTASSEQATE